jgi:hypothetical protein
VIRMHGRRVVGPNGPGLRPEPWGRGGPSPAPTPLNPQNPRPGIPPPSNPHPSGPGLPDPLAGLGEPIAAAIDKARTDFVAAGSVLLGAVLVVVGLLLATGAAPALGRAARRVARVTPPGRVLG